jgi:TPR repeat protein
MTDEEIEDIYETWEAKTARAVLTPLAEAGNPVAQFYLGHLCDEETPPDRKDALTWYRKSSEGGYLRGTHYLASFIYHGIGVRQNIVEALQLFRAAAVAGLDLSQWHLGAHFLNEPGHRDEAIDWLQRAAAQGNQLAIDLLKEASGEPNC